MGMLYESSEEFVCRRKAAHRKRRRLVWVGVVAFFAITLSPLLFGKRLTSLSGPTRALVGIWLVLALVLLCIYYFLRASRIGQTLGLVCPNCGADHSTISPAEESHIISTGTCSKCGVRVVGISKERRQDGQ